MTEKYTHLNTKEGDFHTCEECYYIDVQGEPCSSCHIRNGLGYPMRFKLDITKELTKIKKEHEEMLDYLIKYVNCDDAYEDIYSGIIKLIESIKGKSIKEVLEDEWSKGRK